MISSCFGRVIPLQSNDTHRKMEAIRAVAALACRNSAIGLNPMPGYNSTARFATKTAAVKARAGPIQSSVVEVQNAVAKCHARVHAASTASRSATINGMAVSRDGCRPDGCHDAFADLADISGTPIKFKCPP